MLRPLDFTDFNYFRLQDPTSGCLLEDPSVATLKQRHICHQHLQTRNAFRRLAEAMGCDDLQLRVSQNVAYSRKGKDAEFEAACN